MAIDKPTSVKLKKFADVFQAARERKADESNTVMYLVKFFEEVLGYDPLAGEITKEIPIKDRNCDFAIFLDGKPKPEFLVEAKAAHVKNLNEKHIEQAENYAQRAAVNWVLLTNGVEWHLWHLAFDNNGCTPDLVFSLNFVEKLATDPDLVWATLSVLIKSNVQENSLADYYEQQKLLSPKTIVATLVSEEVLLKIRQELNRKAKTRLDIKDVFHAVLHVLDEDAKDAAGGLLAPMKKKKHRHQRTTKDSVSPEPSVLILPSQTQPQAASGEGIQISPA
ncbi:MAG: hypothetical protein JWR26_1773 [Pedosphaera sp.]|nr:hypothetical protein [Pedosphaera sp.]